MDNISLVRQDSERGKRSTKRTITHSKKATPRTKKRTQSKSKQDSSTPSSKNSTPNWSKILSPKNFEESMTTISTLRNFCKNCVKYIQQADGLLDTLYVTSTSLKESGILKKLSESKGKNLNTTDLTTLLLALMNTPLGSNFFKRMTGGNDDSETPATTTEPAKQISNTSSQTKSALLPPSLPQQQNTARPPYGYPPGSMPM